MVPNNKFISLNKELSNIKSLYDDKILFLKKEYSELIYTYKDAYKDLLKEYFRDIFNFNKKINNIKFSIYRDWNGIDWNGSYFGSFIINDNEINELEYMGLTGDIETYILDIPKEILYEYSDKDVEVYIKDNEIIIEFNEFEL